jgi:pyruvate,orthophosphate dikinase
VEQLHEANPMLGPRGCRLCVTYPEILEMQVRAIIEAAVRCVERGIKVLPEIMIPLTIEPRELALLVRRTRIVAEEILAERKVKLSYLVGTMVETPRAALLADGMAQSAEFFSFGTNDLTQLALGISRDDAGKFLPDYLQGRAGDAPLLTRATQISPILPHDPFQSVDVEGVGLLVQTACAKGRAARPDLKLGVCGEHGGDAKSIDFFERVGLDYVSCSPFRVPIARLAAAQASIRQGTKPKASKKRVEARLKRPRRSIATRRSRTITKGTKSRLSRRPVKSRTRSASDLDRVATTPRRRAVLVNV